VLIDAENSSWRTLAPILKKIASFGIPSEKRVYGDFTMPSLSEWRAVSREQSFTMMQTVNVIPGKGSSDAALIIDAMDMMYTHPALDGYALVSSDSDFTSLARRLRGAGKHVLGFGSFLTHTQLVSACDRFTYTE
ncbi:limkain-b1-type NYN domain-containing protein, partial [Baffinella frigidus]